MFKEIPDQSIEAIDPKFNNLSLPPSSHYFIIFGIRTEDVFLKMWTVPLIYLSVAKDALRSVE